MDNILQNADILHKEASDLLSSMGLLKLLTQYGNSHLTGSYYYNLMTWRDIDICVEIDSVDKTKIFEVGRAIALFPYTSTMYFRNEFVLNTVGNPKGIFWCVEILLPSSQLWKIDILFANKEEIHKILKNGEEIKQKVTPSIRRSILEIKTPLSKRLEYRRSYRSVDIYHAVIHDGIRTVGEWDIWWKAKKR
ncbi:hypothetical protein NEF87_000229 [Candidatus Lokiarchaeum ossiferum]|uniref:Nucleotidyltransferase family protein n=1 Tax=Candidatus Lokiarchaeum ossiferum TaxID=2951803 RepID=A0ABY6HK95_9ARCH|nr:hypothetical protein NEF87_000229 [Candidatus Lokiarchaeum sp. B-35]